VLQQQTPGRLRLHHYHLQLVELIDAGLIERVGLALPTWSFMNLHQWLGA
jgi:hypothetical protein